MILTQTQRRNIIIWYPKCERPLRIRTAGQWDFRFVGLKTVFIGHLVLKSEVLLEAGSTNKCT